MYIPGGMSNPSLAAARWMLTTGPMKGSPPTWLDYLLMTKNQSFTRSPRKNRMKPCAAGKWNSRSKSAALNLSRCRKSTMNWRNLPGISTTWKHCWLIFAAASKNPPPNNMIQNITMGCLTGWWKKQRLNTRMRSWTRRLNTCLST